VQAANPGFTWENGRKNDTCVVHVPVCDDHITRLEDNISGVYAYKGNYFGYHK